MSTSISRTLWRHRDFRLLWFGQVFGTTGMWMDEVTRGWLIYELTDSALQLGLARGTVLAAGYLLWMLQKVAFGRPKPEFADAHIHDVSIYEWVAWLPILLLIVVLGLFPNIIFHVTDPAVLKIMSPFS